MTDLSSFSVDQQTTTVIENIGKLLFSYHQSETIEKLQIPGLLNDIAFLHRKDAENPEWNLFEYLELYLKQQYFNGEDACTLADCKYMKINTRDRLKEQQTTTATTTTTTNKKKKNTASDFLLCSIHCSLMHAFDSGYRLTRDEQNSFLVNINGSGNGSADDAKDGDDNDEVVAENDEEMEEEIEDEIAFDLIDKQAAQMKRVLNARRQTYQSMREDMSNGSEDNNNNNNNAASVAHQNTNASKFVTIVEVEEDADEEVEDEELAANTNGAQPKKTKKKKKSFIGYSFGIRFYYWATFQNRAEKDTYYNQGRYTFADWFVPKKYSSFKEELFQNPFSAVRNEAWDDENVKIDQWMLSKYCKGMTAYKQVWYGFRELYGVPKGTAVSKSHLQSLFYYTNFTSLCTLFSRVFRRIPSSESDESLKAKNSIFREWARLLIEMIHCFGTLLSKSKISIFYHGISIEMTFSETFATFCSPTSTTDSLPIAMTFAQTGMILDLKNTLSPCLTYFDCVMSDFVVEREKLFMNGGFVEEYSEPANTALTFYSIRSLGHNINFRLFITAISAFQQIIKGRNAIWNTLSSTKANVRALKLLVSNQIQRKAVPETEKSIFYVQTMFGNYVESISKAQVFIPCMNTRYAMKRTFNSTPQFFLYRKVFYELYSKEEMEANRNAWEIPESRHLYHAQRFVNPIKSVKFNVLLDLLPNMTQLEIVQLPITHHLMKQLLLTIQETKSRQIERVFVGILWEETASNKAFNYPAAQSDFQSYKECVHAYQAAYRAQEWELKAIEMQNVRVSGGREWFVSGVEMVAHSSTLDNQVWKAFWT